MRFFEIFLFSNANLVFAIAMKNQRSPIDDFLKEIFVENSQSAKANNIDLENDASPAASSNEKTRQAETDGLIDYCREVYDVDNCFQTVLGSNYF